MLGTLHTLIHRLRQQPFIELMANVWQVFEHHQSRQSARALTYTTLFAIVPLLTVLLVLLSSSAALAPARAEILKFIYYNLLPSSGDVIEQYLTSFANASSNLTALGGVILFITTIMTLAHIERTFNQVWSVKRARGGLQGFGHYWMMITLGPLLLGAVVVVLSAISSYHLMYVASIKGFLNHNFTGYTVNIDIWLEVLSFGVLAFGYSLLFWGMPNHPVTWRAAGTAGMVSAVLLLILKQCFAIFVGNFSSYTLVYGAFAAFPILLLWIHLMWVITLFGNALCYTVSIRRDTAQAKHSDNDIINILDILALLQRQQQQGLGLTEAEIYQQISSHGPQHWQAYRAHLEAAQLITQTQYNTFVLCRSLYHVDLWQFLQILPYKMPTIAQIEQQTQHLPWLAQCAPLLIHAITQSRDCLSIPLSRVVTVHLGNNAIDSE